MFAERKPDSHPPSEPWFQRVTRRHPGLFTAGLILLTVLVVLGLLYEPVETVVLYQGF
jgi:hypothetical protein